MDVTVNLSGISSAATPGTMTPEYASPITGTGIVVPDATGAGLVVL